MRRMMRQELASRFAAILRGQAEFKGKGALALHASNRVSTIADELAKAVDGQCVMTIHTDVIDTMGTPGHWGTHEPDPAGPPRPPKKII